MKKTDFDFSAIGKLTLFQLRTHKNALIGWSVSMFGVMFLYMILFPSMQDMAQMKLDAMPTELLQMFNMEEMSELNNFVNYFGMIYNLALVAIAIFSAGFGVNLFTAEEKSHRIEALAALPLSRTEVYLANTLTGFFGTVIVVAASIIATLLCGFINGGETFILLDVITIAKFAGFIPCFFLAIGVCLGAALPRHASAYLGSGAVGLLYLLGYLGKLLEGKADWLHYASPFEVLYSSAILAMEPKTMVAIGIYYLIFIALFLLGWAVYRKRDLAL